MDRLRRASLDGFEMFRADVRAERRVTFGAFVEVLLLELLLELAAPLVRVVVV